MVVFSLSSAIVLPVKLRGYSILIRDRDRIGIATRGISPLLPATCWFFATNLSVADTTGLGYSQCS